LKYLVFEMESELRSIAPSVFRSFSASSIFIPQSVRFIGFTAFADSEAVTCVCVDRNSSLIQLTSKTFSSLSYLSVITIPSSVRHIHDSAFREFRSLRCFAFESPSQCWCPAFDAFANCRLLVSVVLPPSVGVIGQTVSNFSEHIP
jgi:hypothetical protein